MSRSLGVGSSEPEHRSTAAQVLQSFLDELEDTALLIANASPAIDGLPAAADINWASIGGLERKLKRVSMLCAEKTCMEVAGTPVAQGGGESTGLSYRSVHALLRLLLASHRSTQEPAARVADLALLTLANLLESPPWRHIFFRALNEVQLEQEQSDEAVCNETPISGGGSSRGSPATLQDILWKRIIAGSPPSPLTLPLPLASRAGVGESSDTDECPQLHTFSGLASPVDHSAVRLTCHMVRHCPFSFPASSYASLAPQLTDYLLRYSTRAPVASNRGRPISGRAGDGNCKTTDIRNTPAGVGAGVKDGGLQTGLSQDLVVLLDVFAACVRGSPHFRQYVKGSRSKRELLRRLLGLLNSSAPSPSDDGRGDSRGAIVVRALCALTRLLAGDGLEAKVSFASRLLQVFQQMFWFSVCSEYRADLNATATSETSRGGNFLGSINISPHTPRALVLFFQPGPRRSSSVLMH